MSRRRRILLVTYEYPPVGGGMGKAARAIGRALLRRGYDVAVLTSRFRGQPRDERHTDGLRVLRIPVLRRHINYASAAEVLSFAASGALHAGWVKRRFRPTACVAFLTIPSGFVAEVLRLTGGPPWIDLLRGQDVPGYPDTPRWMHRLAWPVTWTLWHRAAHVVANSEGLAALAHESDAKLPIRIMPNGIDVERYVPPAKGRFERTVRVLYAGRLVRFKGLRNLIEAWRLVARGTRMPAELWIAGHGPERPVLEALAEQAGLANSVRFLGRLEEDKLIRALQRADIFVNPSEGEGMPNAVLEAMACGLPVVLSDIAPHREMLVGGRGGVLCDATRPQAIARALLDVMDDRETRLHLGEEAREIVRTHFSWDQAVETLDGLLE
jgi:glycosyltransferase involved in cell wall biosynthesis